MHMYDGVHVLASGTRGGGEYPDAASVELQVFVCRYYTWARLYLFRHDVSIPLAMGTRGEARKTRKKKGQIWTGGGSR